MIDHSLRLVWDDSDARPYVTLICDAPADAACRAVWSCDCEMVYGYSCTDGVPLHTTEDGTVHRGAIDLSECNIRDWIENDAADMRGEMIVPIRVERTGDEWPTIHVLP